MGRHRILVVDDEPLITRVISRVLTGDYAVTCCKNGAEALAVLRAEPPFDIILCDVVMPEMSGIELFRHLSPEEQARVVFMTGGQLVAQQRAELRELSAPILYKPFPIQELRDAVEARLAALTQAAGTG